MIVLGIRLPRFSFTAGLPITKYELPAQQLPKVFSNNLKTFYLKDKLPSS